MQTHHPGNLPSIILLLPDDDEFTWMGGRTRRLGIVMEFVHTHFNSAKTFNGVNFYASFYQFAAYFTTDVFFGFLQQFLFGGHQTTLVVVEFDGIRISSCLFYQVTIVVRIKENTILQEDRIV
jgi:hypothetical protein